MKNIFLTVFFIFAANTAFGEALPDDLPDNYNYGVTFLPVKYEINISENSQLNHELTIGLVNFHFEDSITGLGIETRLILPVYYYNFNDHIISYR
ncbi:MAG: hypothetical protein LBU85_02540 [Treponema sp.]|jgi:hypothetical protein|nr:hypothetical protein [Treponema sp.]